MKTELASPLYWGMTDLAHEVAREAMENRATVEVDEVEKARRLRKYTVRPCVITSNSSN